MYYVALVAQSVERQAFNLVVRGSSPREGVGAWMHLHKNSSSVCVF